MKLFGSARWLLMALLLSMVPASSYAGVFISVGFAPPALPVYEQPPCPQPGLMWTPGYWSYGPDGYYWVPGAWAPAPYEGALWTPGYWGYSSNVYVWHPGYWGPHVGYYGGVNYGFGYMGVGFAGGMWRGHDFVYNTAVVRVNRTIVHNTYIDRTVVEHNTIVNERRVAYSGGPGGIRHDPRPEERIAEHDSHVERTQFQTQHVNAAMNDHNAYYHNNGGHPPNPVYDHGRPESHPEPPIQSHYNQPANQYHPQPTQYQPKDNHQAPTQGGHYDARPAPPQQHPQGHPEQQSHPQGHPEHDQHEHGKGR
jgi:WXXGXW repeat (2 copies)